MYAGNLLLQRLRDQPMLLHLRQPLERVAFDADRVERAASPWGSVRLLSELKDGIVVDTQPETSCTCRPDGENFFVNLSIIFCSPALGGGSGGSVESQRAWRAEKKSLRERASLSMAAVSKAADNAEPVPFPDMVNL